MKTQASTDEGPIFLCGAHGCDVLQCDEHTKAGAEYMGKMMRVRFEAGKPGTFDEAVEFLREGEEASRRRMSIREYREIEAAVTLLERHRFSVTPP